MLIENLIQNMSENKYYKYFNLETMSSKFVYYFIEGLNLF